jgi:uncharacterized membrane protein
LNDGDQNQTSEDKPSEVAPEVAVERVRQPDPGSFTPSPARSSGDDQKQPDDDRGRLEKHGQGAGVSDSHGGPVSDRADDSRPWSELEELQLKLEREEHWSGPLPSPATLYQYEMVKPGLAERIVAMAETVTTGEIKIREKVATAEIETARTGQALAFLLTLIAIGAAIYFFAVGNDVAGGVLLGVPVVMLIRSFLTGLQSGDNPRADEDSPADDRK